MVNMHARKYTKDWSLHEQHLVAYQYYTSSIHTFLFILRSALNKEILDLLKEESISEARSGSASL